MIQKEALGYGTRLTIKPFMREKSEMQISVVISKPTGSRPTPGMKFAATAIPYSGLSRAEMVTWIEAQKALVAEAIKVFDSIRSRAVKEREKPKRTRAG